MKLDKDTNDDGIQKYAVINLRRLNSFNKWTPEISNAFKILEEAGVLEWGHTGDPNEFFLIKLKDKYAKHALEQYSVAVGNDDPEYANAVFELSKRAGKDSPFCKTPD